jgi:hypothetical protein
MNAIMRKRNAVGPEIDFDDRAPIVIGHCE